MGDKGRQMYFLPREHKLPDVDPELVLFENRVLNGGNAFENVTLRHWQYYIC